MTFSTINVGALANDNTGDSLRDAFIKVNSNFLLAANTSVAETITATWTFSRVNVKNNIVRIGVNEFSTSFDIFTNSAFLVLDKLTEEDDASIVFRQAGAIKWEVGSTTELPAASNDFHIKRVTGAAGSETFTDIFIWDFDTGDGRVIDGFKFGVGTIPVELFHVARTDTVARVISKFENGNTGAGSKSAAIQLAANTFSWTTGIDFGLDGSDNWFLQGSGGVNIFATPTGVRIGGSTLPTEALDVTGNIQTDAISFVGSFTVATLPSATKAGGQIFVSDETGGATIAFSDGINWRRTQDRAIVS